MCDNAFVSFVWSCGLEWFPCTQVAFSLFFSFFQFPCCSVLFLGPAVAAGRHLVGCHNKSHHRGWNTWGICWSQLHFSWKDNGLMGVPWQLVTCITLLNVILSCEPSPAFLGRCDSSVWACQCLCFCQGSFITLCGLFAWQLSFPLISIG